MQSDLNVCEPTFSPRSRVLKGRDDAMIAEKRDILSGLAIYLCAAFLSEKVYDKCWSGS